MPTGSRFRLFPSVSVASAVFSLMVVAIWQLGGSCDRETLPRRDLAVYRGAGDTLAVDRYEQWLGHRVDRVVDFVPGGTWKEIEDPGWMVERWAKAEREVVYGVPLLPSDEDGSLESGSKGLYDAHFRRLAESLVEGAQGDSILRLGWEFNGGWYRWRAADCPSCFVRYWRRVVEVMRGVKGAQFRFDWNPTLGREEIAADLVYPGDEYVDLIGLDVYDHLGDEGELTPRERWNRIKTRPYGLEWHRDFAASHDKPMTFPEWGVSADSDEDRSKFDDAYFIDAMADWIETNDVEYHAYFEFDASDGLHALAGGHFPGPGRRFLRRFGGDDTGSRNQS